MEDHLIALKKLSEYIVNPLDYEFRRGNKSKDGSKISYLTYIQDTPLMNIMHEILGHEWSSETVFNGRAVTCTIEYRGIKRSGSSAIKETEYNGQDNDAKAAETDAFKRACFRMGLAKYLYTWPKIVVPSHVVEKVKFRKREFHGVMLFYVVQGIARDPFRSDKLESVLQSCRSYYGLIKDSCKFAGISCTPKDVFYVEKVVPDKMTTINKIENEIKGVPEKITNTKKIENEIEKSMKNLRIDQAKRAEQMNQDLENGMDMKMQMDMDRDMDSNPEGIVGNE